MPWLADTNILIRFINADDPLHTLVRRAVAALIARAGQLWYAQQSRREFWNVCTRPVAANGMGYTVNETRQALVEVDATFNRVPDVPTAGPEWDRLVTQYGVIGRAVHDAQLVASMLVNGITHILTLNVVDFARFAGEITVVHPRDV
jgi:predicted nucleic acid-binding protein